GKANGWQARARIVTSATAAVEPTICLTATVPATRKALSQAKLKAEDIDLWECNEAFASVAYYFQRTFELPDDRFNVNGGAIALGHPLGATGAILLGTLLDELERRDLRRGLVTLCGGGGLATATIIERV
ncbi:MAG: acetyl-CoA C-acyltransferase, partial [Lewinella sp.]|nr:acetyl-CoA C-acyltransferase [Lewinella sp.]